MSKLDLSSLIKPLLDSNHVHIVKETLWVTSNIIGIDEAIASQVMNADVLQSLGRCLNYGENIQKEVKLLHLVRKDKVYILIHPHFKWKSLLPYKQLPICHEIYLMFLLSMATQITDTKCHYS